MGCEQRCKDRLVGGVERFELSATLQGWQGHADLFTVGTGPGRFSEATASPKSLGKVISPHGGGARLRPSAKASNVIRSDLLLAQAKLTEQHLCNAKILASAYKPHLPSIKVSKVTCLMLHRIRVFKTGSARSGNADGLTNSKEHDPEVGSQRVPALISAGTEELRR
ncbi:hypothetical protein BU25DRAFT_196888 [Macroventuria anomochaeta]|uniref:Uncharacterized protein n=1 Tax=Macroventuria anomochaeta TaxID=301207 RepID=A0ACB6SBY7_9PLEO|nr:uncharacterized protein BU25DRAFT_196888 [Macroventuria anomochaeta]KAF2631790.1 hypothetical protein BU25DRAFT_196888 [Macroventuria anomochaeta]